jgi:hypothetical protein
LARFSSSRAETIASTLSSVRLSRRIAATERVNRSTSRREVRPKISQTRLSRINGALAIAARVAMIIRSGAGGLL